MAIGIFVNFTVKNKWQPDQSNVMYNSFILISRDDHLPRGKW